MQNSMSNEDDRPKVPKVNISRCLKWLENQNNEMSKQSLQNKNDIQFIIQTNADRKNFLLNSAEDDATVPTGVGEIEIEPKVVPISRLRFDNLQMECEWQSCNYVTTDYNLYQTHVKQHISELHVIDNIELPEYVCLWDICGSKTTDLNEMVRHINFHAYHGHLLAIGLNARATLKLLRCKKDSTKRNVVPSFKSDHFCMWTECNEKFNSIQEFFDHVRMHIDYSESFVCLWGGCGGRFSRRVLLHAHVRSHTREKLLACYHCGAHFVVNRKLADHLRRQNVSELCAEGEGGAARCSICGAWCGSESLRRDHERQHVSAAACSLCDMTAPSLAALAQHVRYRHLPPALSRHHPCTHCDYRAVTKSDLRKHILTHTKKKKPQKRKKDDEDEEEEMSDEDNLAVQKKKIAKKYACHLCPEDKMKVFSRGARLTQHFVKFHEAQWPCGYSRFRYQKCDDGFYRLTTTRYEVLEISKKIVDGCSSPKGTITNLYDFNVEVKCEPATAIPRSIEIMFKGANNNEKDNNNSSAEKDTDPDKKVEITMCDVDEHGNILKSEVISDIVYSSS